MQFFLGTFCRVMLTFSLLVLYYSIPLIEPNPSDRMALTYPIFLQIKNYIFPFLILYWTVSYLVKGWLDNDKGHG